MGTSFLDALKVRAAMDPRHVVLSEGISARVQEAAAEASRTSLARLTLLGPEEEIRQGLSRFNCGEQEISVLDPRQSGKLDQYAEEYSRVRGHKAPDEQTVRKIVTNVLGHAAMMVRMGEADGTIGGATNTTADTIRTFLQIIGRQPECDLVSAFFIMVSEQAGAALGEAVLFADCALVVEPDAGQLATIAESTARSARALLGVEPKVALLSFSTAGSGSHPRADRVREAISIARRRQPETIIPYELQFDAAVDEVIQQRKLPAGEACGIPNVFIFPGLESANIGYKIAERTGRMKAVGTVLQGLAKPANDLSRGCAASDILELIAVTSLQAQAAARASPVRQAGPRPE